MKISQQRQVLNGAGDLKKAVLPHNSPGGVRIYLKSLFIQFRASPRELGLCSASYSEPGSDLTGVPSIFSSGVLVLLGIQTDKQVFTT